jgi:glutamine synthetase type III
MRVLDLPDTLQTSLATATLAQVLDYRYALADKIELARRHMAAEKHAAASTLLSTKAVKDWTPEDHLSFMDASGDHRMPSRIVAKHIGMNPPPAAKSSGFGRNLDSEIPF